MQTNEESKKLIQQLQPEVSGFSRSFQLNGKNKDEVVCGGKIKQITDMSMWSDLDGSDIVYATLDDAIGEIMISVPGVIWRRLSADIGDIVIAKGFLYRLKKECTFQSKAGVDIVVPRKDEPFRVLVMSIKKLDAE